MALLHCIRETSPANDTDAGDTTVIIKSQEIAPSGGTVAITGSGTSLDGMSITIPEGSFSTSQTISIGYKKMDSSVLPDNVSAYSSLVTIQGCKGYADSLIFVKIPVTVPPGTFAMPFSYDSVKRRFEGLPIVELTGSSVTFETRRLTLRGQENGSLLKGEEAYFLQLVILGIAEETLRGKGEISTAFTPGVDDWEFVNRGSYIARGGHCAGQSITALWYFDEKKAALGPLFSRFDHLDAIEQDNPHGYRFASVVHQDLQWDGAESELFFAIRGNPLFARWSWWAFALSMYVTASPQYVGLKSTSGGHAILAYKMSLNDSLLYVADPNFPGKARTIRFVSDSFAPYSSRQNADDVADKPYSAVGYRGVSSLISWEAIGQRWREMEDGTIGTIVPNSFPSYTLIERDNGEEAAIADSIIITGRDTLELLVRCPSCDTGYGGTDAQPLRIFDNTGVYIATTDLAEIPDGTRGVIRLLIRKDTARLGITINGSFKTKPPDNQRSSKFLDFKWITVLKRQVRISPVPITGEPGKSIPLNARTSLHNVEEYVWDFGDGSDEVQTTETTVSHSWENGGDYTIRLLAFDDRGWLISTDTAAASITGPAPVLSSLSPLRAPAGDTVTLRGSSFGSRAGSGRYVSFLGDTIRDPVLWTDTLIRVIVPEKNSGYAVYVYASGKMSNTLSFTITTRNPSIQSISPSTVEIDSMLTIKGRHFKYKLNTTAYQRVTKVRFAPASGTLGEGTISSSLFADWTDTSIVVKVPYVAITGNMYVIADDSSSNPAGCTVVHDFSKPVSCNIILLCNTEDKKISTGVVSSTTNSRMQWTSGLLSHNDSSLIFGFDSLTVTPESVKVIRKCGINADIGNDTLRISVNASTYSANWFPATDSTWVLQDLAAKFRGIPVSSISRQPSSTPGDTLTYYKFQMQGDSVCTYIDSLSRSTNTTVMTGYSCAVSSYVSMDLIVKK
jgi:hypothetical protein